MKPVGYHGIRIWEKHEVVLLKFPYLLHSRKFQVRWKGNRKQMQRKFGTGRGLPVKFLAVCTWLKCSDLSFDISHHERVGRYVEVRLGRNHTNPCFICSYSSARVSTSKLLQLCWPRICHLVHLVHARSISRSQPGFPQRWELEVPQ